MYLLPISTNLSSIVTEGDEYIPSPTYKKRRRSQLADLALKGLSPHKHLSVALVDTVKKQKVGSWRNLEKVNYKRQRLKKTELMAKVFGAQESSVKKIKSY